MAKSLLQHRVRAEAEKVWEIVRVSTITGLGRGAGESAIEDGKSGDAVGAVRNVLYQERRIRQRLLAQSDVEALADLTNSVVRHAAADDYRPL